MFYILPYQHDPEANQAVQGTGTDNPIEGSSTAQQATSTIPATLNFVIQSKQVQQSSIELCTDHEIKQELVKEPEKIPKRAKSPSTSSLPAKKRKVKAKTKKIVIKGNRCGMCWRTFPNIDLLEVHKCSKAGYTCNCNLCLAARRARSPSQKKYKCCSMCSTYYKCVHYLKKHVDKYHGSCKCRICKTKFKTRRECCKHLCPGPQEDSETSVDSDSDTTDEQSEDIEIDNTNTSTNEVLQEYDIEIEYIIESERPESPSITFKSIQRKEDYHKVAEDTDKSSQITLGTPVLIDIQNRTFLANEVNLNITDNYSEINPNQTKDIQNRNLNNVQIESQEIEVVTIEDSDNENEMISGIMGNKEIPQDIKDKTDVTMAASVDIETVESVIVTNDGIKTNATGTGHVIIKNTGDDATKTNNMTIVIPDSDDESINSETELDLIERNNITNKITDVEISESTDDTADDDAMRHTKKTNLDKSRFSISHRNSELKSTHTLRRNIDTVKGIKNTTFSAYACNICKKNFRKESDLMFHKKEHDLHKESNTSLAVLEICNYCNISINKTDLHDHMLVYHNQSKHIVKLENNIYEQEILDKRTKDVLCGVCTEMHSDKWIFNYHIKQEHETDDSIEDGQIQPIITRESYLNFKDF